MQLNKAYNKDDFKDFLSGFLPDDLSLNEKELVIGNNYKNIKSGLVLGESKSLGVKVFYLEHEKEKDPRVALTTEAFKILSENWAKKAVVVFNSRNSENWRLSLMTISFDINEKNKIVSNLSNPKRKSFFLGPNAKIATANQFLFSKGKAEDFEDLESRFDVEIVTKEFFNNYKKLYTKLLDYLKNDRAFNVFADKHGLELEIFGKKLLGQIVFIYFLQKKGWLGAKKGDNISNGDKAFLRSLFAKCKQDGKNFFNDCLEHLFYNCLNKLPERAGSFYREKFDCQIPFLNGGLFEPINDYRWHEEFINIPNEIFSNNEDSGILDIFDLYNFTIDENTPDDQEISVDPEMLGKVFENLLESNTRKGQGAFYTPREIVHYMCQESLINYLDSNSGIGRKTAEEYVKYFDSREDIKTVTGWEEEIVKLDKLVQNIKVCDPACGSGAFLVGMLNEIIKLRYLLRILNPNLPKRTVYDLKKETIQNCLYGVDIDPGAVDIAKLRFWLSIVVDENIDDIEPLPNLDYKIMQGNSLLEDLVIGDSAIKFNFDGRRKIDGRTREQKELFAQGGVQGKLILEESDTLAEKLERYHAEYFSVTDPEKKKILKKKIDNIEDELIQSKCQEEIRSAESVIQNSTGESKKILKSTEKTLAVKGVLEKWKKDKLRPFFPWKLHFGEVFNRENGGFDVVIANPPYGADIDKKELKFIKNNLANTKNGNSAAVFIDFGKNKWINKTGTLTYIVPKSLLFAERWFDLVLSMLGKVPFVIDVEKAFENVKLEQVVFMFGKTIKTSFYQGRKFLNNEFLRSTKISNSLVDKYNAWVCDISEKELLIGEKINSKEIEYLKNISETKRGVGMQKFLTDGGKYPVIGGKNIFRYGISGVKGYISENDMANNGKIGFLRQPKIISQRLVAHIQNPEPHMMIMASLDEKGDILSVDTVENTILTSNKFDYKYILALLNSKLISWYAYKFIYCSAIRTMDLDNYYIGKIPIIKAKPEQQQEIIRLTDKIIELTKAIDYANNYEKQSMFQEYDKQINQVAYELYGLTENEIKIIEGK